MGWSRGYGAGAEDAAPFGIKGFCVWVKQPQPGERVVNLFVSLLYRILLPKKEKRGWKVVCGGWDKAENG